METEKPITLIIDEHFKELIRPLRKDEYLLLEANLNADGCRDPITTWNGVIIDGHNRYEICHRLGIPFKVKEMKFNSREEVIVWICANQLGRRNITEETRKYLIGMQYESEKLVASKRKEKGKNQYAKNVPYETFGPDEMSDSLPSSNRSTAMRLANEHHVSHATVEKYGVYARALEEIGHKEPAIIAKVLSGRFKISHDNIIELSQRSTDDIKLLNRKMEQTQAPFVQYSSSRKEIQQELPKKSKPVSLTPSIKDMPPFDPDAEITGLTLTIPSWTHSIAQTRSKANLCIATKSALTKLIKALHELDNEVQEMLNVVEED